LKMAREPRAGATQVPSRHGRPLNPPPRLSWKLLALASLFMSTYALITGQLFRAPEQRTAKNGNPFVTATIRVKDNEGEALIEPRAVPAIAGAVLQICILAI
jgi:hypothetical protein